VAAQDTQHSCILIVQDPLKHRRDSQLHVPATTVAETQRVSQIDDQTKTANEILRHNL
jgi:hypothetical protein